MTLPVFLAEDLDPAADDLSVGDRARLGGPEGHHAAAVRRLAPGESLDVVDGRGLRLRCAIEAASAHGIDVVVRERITEPEPDSHVVLVQALAKGGRDEQAVETATEIGVDEVVPWQADRSIVRWSGAKAAKAHAKWQSVVRAAAKQSRRARHPEVGGLVDSKALVARVGATVARGGVALVCHEEGAQTLAEFLRGWSDGSSSRPGGRAPLVEVPEILIVVGPEGGISSDELAALEEAGAEIVLLGPHVLRSSTAGPAAAVLVSAAAGRWS